MSHLNNTTRDLTEGLVTLLRTEVNGWPLVSGENFPETENVWPKQVPTKPNTGEPKAFPYGAVDLIAGNDFDLSVELDVRLREVTIRVTVFGEESGTVEDLVDASEDAIADHWESYTGDWSFRQIDGFVELSESEGTEGKLRYSRSVDAVFETVKD